jgi:hypothetical protein
LFWGGSSRVLGLKGYGVCCTDTLYGCSCCDVGCAHDAVCVVLLWSLGLWVEVFLSMTSSVSTKCFASLLW